MKINEQSMTFHERLKHFSFFTDHWILFTIILSLILIIGITITIIINKKTHDSYKKNKNLEITILPLGICGAALVILLFMTFNLYFNTNNMKYINYNTTGKVINNKPISNEKQDVTFTSGVNKYHIILPETVNVKKDTILKISSNGNITTDDIQNSKYINVSKLSKGHKLNIKIKQKDKWYPVDVYVYDDVDTK